MTFDLNEQGIVVDGVSRSFGEVRAVQNVSFTVEHGEVVGLLGPNGAGKTTTLRMMSTLLKPDDGRIRIEGLDVTESPIEVRASIGYQTGDTGLYERLTPVEFLRYFGRLNGFTNNLEARIRTLVDDLSISEFGDRLCNTLSTGQKQRVSLARTLLHDPPVLILDEPTSGLDIVSSEFILKALRQAAEDGRAVLFSTHIMSEIELICDRIVILHRGRVIARGTLEEILELTGEPQLTHAFLALIHAVDSAAAEEEGELSA